MPTFSTSTVTATLVAATAYTAIEIKTPSSTGIKIVKWWVELNSITSTNNNVLLQIGAFSAAVTTLTSQTPAKVDWGNSSIGSQCTVGVNATVEGAVDQEAVPLLGADRAARLHVRPRRGADRARGRRSAARTERDEGRQKNHRESHEGLPTSILALLSAASSPATAA